MEKTHFIILLFALLLNSCCYTLAVESGTTMKTFKSSQTLFTNPERGWIVHRFSNNMWGLDNLRNSAEKVSLVLIKIDISAYRNRNNIALEKLNEIRNSLDKCRTQGLKVILRSAYAWDWNEALPLPDPEDIQTITNHVIDMKPIYNAFEDIIIAVEMGMFGPWGEMHSSKHSTVNTKPFYPIRTDALRLVHNAYMSALPQTHSVLVRRPSYIREIFNNSEPIRPNEAYANTGKARTGYHNDAYLNSKDDAGTFAPNWSREDELAYVNKMTSFTFFGGEAFGTPNNAYNNANNALKESKQQHMTYLHRDYEPEIYDAWGSLVKQEFTRKLGYRFELKELAYSREVTPCGVLYFILKLENTGFAAMHLKRPVNLILVNGKRGNEQKTYETTLSVDPRIWTPESGIITINRNLRIPGSITEGIWQLFLSMPDISERLKHNPHYAVRFANEDVWTDDGRNMLIEELNIVASPSGSCADDQYFQEIPINSASLITQLSAMKTVQSLILSATYSKNYIFYQVFIDADNNSTTGYHVQGIGAEVLVENNAFYHHKGKTGTNWEWELVDGNIMPSNYGYKYLWQLPILHLKLPIMAYSQVVFAGTIDDKTDYSSIISVTVA
ncbi:unnamed protein product [Rotaria socialis]|uniref:DUF4832 domain-containing protein n=2 Tax=Rotaria socialis TaxID=392032 RepID=A0A821Q6L7_9BILA|nr:unnamed protein product [Rotaria socialis]CAF3719690.1 unnamed protein product [Rotaria socialis]CAF4447012.1 unnamed protein product [Rotaria socialis]CAF4551276.1 unnamed protein product [Rotaria socialis]CAF4817963.1 unnamed protein product [Rotaria socialis]